MKLFLVHYFVQSPDLLCQEVRALIAAVSALSILFPKEIRTTSEFFSNLQLAAMPNLQLAEKGMSQAESGNTGLYFGVNYSVARIGSYNLKYRTNAKEAWELDSNVAGSAQLGYDFGLVRLDVKAVATDGGVDTIGGAAAGNDRSNVAVATANIYWDVMRSEVGDEIALVPFSFVDGHDAISCICK